MYEMTVNGRIKVRSNVTESVHVAEMAKEEIK
jgi:hypothetical protein